MSEETNPEDLAMDKKIEHNIKQNIQDTIDLIVRLRVEAAKLNNEVFPETLKLINKRVEELRELVLSSPH